VLGALLWQAWSAPGLKGLARALLMLLLLQFATGMSNVVLQWPLLLAVAHSGGAALLVAMLVVSCTGFARAGKITRFPAVHSLRHAMRELSAAERTLNHMASQYWALTKPRVTQLALFCTVIGMFLSTRELPPLGRVAVATLGVWLLAGAAFAVNSLIEQHIDAKMARTRMRPMPRGELSALQALLFSGLIGGIGMWVLYAFVNPLTMWLTFATFVGYAVVYTVLLKPYTPQNIVIGGMSGAMPRCSLGRDHGTAPAEAWLLALIIFVWTPPHFWRWRCTGWTTIASRGCRCCP